MLKSADLHETILTPVICHKHVSCHDGGIFISQDVWFLQKLVLKLEALVKKEGSSIQAVYSIAPRSSVWPLSSLILCKGFSNSYFERPP